MASKTPVACRPISVSDGASISARCTVPVKPAMRCFRLLVYYHGHGSLIGDVWLVD
jgi:hypothetical protein